MDNKTLNSFTIIGGGASGIILAANISKLSSGAIIQIMESSGDFGSGVAYSTDDPQHLLNVRAYNMSAFADRPDDFLNWLQSNHPQLDYKKTDFVPRRLYRHYLNNILNELLDNPKITLHHDQAIAVRQRHNNMETTTSLNDHIYSDAVILATGNEAFAVSDSQHIIDPWTKHEAYTPAKNDPIIILGTGLTMIDSVITLLNQGHTGSIYALSRRGLLPQTHQPCPAIALEKSDFSPEKGLVALFRQIRELIKEHNGDWRGVIDGMRPYNAQLWCALSLTDKKRFLRHLRPWWDTYRHRMAPAIADQIHKAITSGQLKVIAGHITNMVELDGAVTVQYEARQTHNSHSLTAPLLIDCRGGNIKLSGSKNPVIQSLLAQRIGKPDALDLGFDVDENLQLISSDGAAQAPVFAIGPVTKGIYWEVTAIPDIRNEALRLARHLTQTV